MQPRFADGSVAAAADIVVGVADALGLHNVSAVLVGADVTALPPAAGAELSQTLRSLFDEIVLDVPPALATADASIVAHRSDGVVVVVRAEATPRDQVASAVRSLSGAPVWGVVLNGVDPARVPTPLPVVKGQLTAGK